MYPPRRINPPSQPRSIDCEDQSKQKPAGLTASETAELEQFKIKLINDRLDAREVQAQDVPDGVRRKAAFEAQLNSCKQHRK